MKILHIINSLQPGGGAQQLLGDLLPALVKNNVKIYVVTLYRCRDSLIERRLSNNNIYIDSIDSKIKYNPLAYFHLKNVIKTKGNFDIIHAHLFPSLYYVSLLASNNNIPLVYTEHNTFNRRRKYKLFKIVENKIYSRYNKILCISNATANSLKKWVPRVSNKIEIVYNGRNFKNFKIAKPLKRSKIGIPNDVPLVISVSSLTAQKDHYTLIKAIKKLPAVHLMIVGEGELKSRLIRFVTELGIKDRIYFLGYRGDVPQLMKTADIFVQSSHWEGFGMTVIESMACGVPVIGTDVPGLNEVIIDGISGILIPPKNENALVSAISLVLNDKTIYNKLQKGGLKRAKDFSIETMAGKIIRIYKKILKNQEYNCL